MIGCQTIVKIAKLNEELMDEMRKDLRQVFPNHADPEWPIAPEAPPKQPRAQE